jgi:F-type H+-transporting ATPase subunit b
MEILEKLGIDWKLLLAQAVNFIVLFFVLRRYAYKPMLDFLEKRSERIEQGIKDAEAAKGKLSEMEVKEKEVLSAARNEARDIVAAAEESAKRRDAERFAETESRVKSALEDAERKIAEEKRRIMDEAKSEIASLVSLSVEKVLQEKINATADKKIIIEQ